MDVDFVFGDEGEVCAVVDEGGGCGAPEETGFHEKEAFSKLEGKRKSGEGTYSGRSGAIFIVFSFLL